jgi:hypothetical protein
MADLNGHATGNGGHSQGTPTAHRALLYSDTDGYAVNRDLALFVENRIWFSFIVDYFWNHLPILSRKHGNLIKLSLLRMCLFRSIWWNSARQLCKPYVKERIGKLKLKLLRPFVKLSLYEIVNSFSSHRAILYCRLSELSCLQIPWSSSMPVRYACSTEPRPGTLVPLNWPNLSNVSLIFLLIRDERFSHKQYRGVAVRAQF